MATDWASDVKKYAPDADDGVIAGIVRYCGIALQKVDSSLVSFSDPKELARVRENFLKKKCALTHSDAELDAAIAAVGDRMKGDRTRNRVTVYYLLSDRFGMHQLFVKAAKGTAKAAGPVAGAAAGVAALTALDGGAAVAAPAKPAAAAKKAAVSKLAAVAAAPSAPVATTKATPLAAATTSAPAVAVAAAAAPLAFAAAGAAGTSAGLSVLGKWTGDSSPLGRKLNLGSKSDGSGAGLLWFAGLAAAILILFAFAGSVGRRAVVPVATVDPAPAMVAAAAAPTAPEAVPEGAGIVSETRDERPVTKVYFATGKADVAPGFAAEAATFKAWLTDHPGSRLGVSGYNDPSGNAAVNAALSKKRAQAVQAALVAGGIPATAIELIKPDAATDANVTAAEARRVEVYVK